MTASETYGIPLTTFLTSLGSNARILHRSGTHRDHGDQVQRLVRWVEPSELADPTPYLLPNECLLTAGMIFDDTTPQNEYDAFVQRLGEASVSALGFGLVPHHDSVPVPLVAACQRHDLTLFEIPSHIPFAAIGMQFARLLESERAKFLASMERIHQQQLAAAVSRRPEADLLRLLTSRTRGWAHLVDSEGRVRVRQGANPLTGEQIAQLHAQALKTSGITTRTVASPSGANVNHVTVLRTTRAQAGEASGVDGGALLVGTREELTPLELSEARSLVGILDVLHQQRSSAGMAPGQLACSLLLDGSSPADDERARSLRNRLLADSIGAGGEATASVIHGLAPRGGTTYTQDLLYWRQLLASKLVQLTPTGMRAITGQRLDASVLADAERAGWRFAVAACDDPDELAQAESRARALVTRVRRSGESVLHGHKPLDLGGLIDSAAGEQFAQELLRPLLAAQRPGVNAEPNAGPSLLNVLASWLRNNGSWEATARATGLHRNSIRRLVEQASEQLGMDLDSADVRAQLIVALSFLQEPS